MYIGKVDADGYNTGIIRSGNIDLTEPAKILEFEVMPDEATIDEAVEWLTMIKSAEQMKLDGHVAYTSSLAFEQFDMIPALYGYKIL